MLKVNLNHPKQQELPAPPPQDLAWPMASLAWLDEGLRGFRVEGFRARGVQGSGVLGFGIWGFVGFAGGDP